MKATSSMAASGRVLLLILDGWGIGKNDESNPIHVVNPKSLQWAREHFPFTSLQASGISVGLPWNEAGNSEVGHLTIGAGRIFYQHLPRISIAIKDGSFAKNQALVGALQHVRERGSTLHLIGLLTKGNTHASLEHLHALIQEATAAGIPFRLHLFTDGQDSPRGSLPDLLRELPQEAVASLVGRHYAMNTEQDWQLTQRAYEIITGVSGTVIAPEALGDTIASYYKEFENESFFPPTRLEGRGTLKDGDAALFFNFREEAMRQLAAACTKEDFSFFPRVELHDIYWAAMTEYEKGLPLHVLFPPQTFPNTLGEVLARQEKTQFRIAETYRYPHITSFMNGYRNEPFPNEYRVQIPSIATQDPSQHPQLMAQAITDRLVQAIENKSFDCIIANYANGDIIAHTGNYQAAIEAVQTIDQQLEKLLPLALQNDTAVLITASHGNIEEAVSPVTGIPTTQHTGNPVPVYLIAKSLEGRTFPNAGDLLETIGLLADIAPTVLELLGIPPPPEMTGKSLLQSLSLPAL